MYADWFFLKQELDRAQKWETVMKLSQTQHLQEVEMPLDWLPWRRLSRQLNKMQNVALQTWRQGSIFTKCADGEETSHLMCPHCNQAATLLHLLWLCPETQKAFPPLEAADKQEIEQGINLDFWSQGLLQLPRYQLSTGGAAVQSWGSWTVHDEVKLKGPEVVTIGLGLTSSDPRLKHYIVAIVHHTLIDGQLYRKGAVTTVLPGRQTQERAWFYGLRAIAHFVDLQTQLKVQVLSTKAWEAWVHGKHKESFFDINELIARDQRCRIRPLSLTQQQIKDMPTRPYTLKARLSDANKVAREIALSIKPTELEAELTMTDGRYVRIAHLAIKRIRHLLEDKDHFLHQARQAGKENRKKARETKTQLFLDIGNQQGEQTHQWATKLRGLQCLKCQKYITKHLKMEELRKVQVEECPAHQAGIVKGGDSTNQPTKAELLKQLATGSFPGMADHSFELQTHYVVCRSCHSRVLRNSARDKLEGLARAPCWNQAWSPDDWSGHKAIKCGELAPSFFAKLAKLMRSVAKRDLRSARHFRKHVARGSRLLCLRCSAAKTARRLEAVEKRRSKKTNVAYV